MAIKIFAVLSIAIFAAGFQDNDNIITWTHSRRLTWDDFLGIYSHDRTYEVINIQKQNETEAARSRVAIALRFQCFDGKPKHIIRAEFEKQNSWYIPKYKANDVLQHEQLHFDITEVYARKLQYKIDTMKNPCDKSAVVSVYQINEKEFMAFTKKYDIETSHGVNKQKQAEWELMVQAMLVNSPK